MKKILLACCVTAMFITGCGGSSDQQQVADLIIQAAEDAGATPDSDCIKDAADRLSDADAKAMVDAGLQNDPVISDAANNILIEILSC